MGFFFFLSALFIEFSIEKKGPRRFVLDRLKRLGIPLIFYSLIISPVLNWYVERYGYDKRISFAQYLSGYHHWVDFGVLWFVAALLLFTFIYVLIRPLIGFNPEKTDQVPGNMAIFLFAFFHWHNKLPGKNQISCGLGSPASQFSASTFQSIHIHVYIGNNCCEKSLA